MPEEKMHAPMATEAGEHDSKDAEQAIQAKTEAELSPELKVNNKSDTKSNAMMQQMIEMMQMTNDNVAALRGFANTVQQVKQDFDQVEHEVEQGQYERMEDIEALRERHKATGLRLQALDRNFLEYRSLHQPVKMTFLDKAKAILAEWRTWPADDDDERELAILAEQIEAAEADVKEVGKKIAERKKQEAEKKQGEKAEEAEEAGRKED